MHSYKLKIIKPVIFVSLIILLIGLVQYLLDILLIGFSDSLRTILFVIFYLLSIIFSYLLSTIKLSIKINNSEVRIDKIRGVLPYQSKFFLLKNISQYQLLEDLNYDMLKIHLKNNAVIRLTKFKDSQDEFQKFSRKFIQIISLLNESEGMSINRISNLYETRGGLMIAIFLALMTFLLLFFGKGSTRIFTVIPALIFFILQVKNYQKNKANSKPDK